MSALQIDTVGISHWLLNLGVSSHMTHNHKFFDSFEPYTRPDISYAVNWVCQYMQQPSDFHFAQVKCVLRYIKGTLDYGRLLRADTDFHLSALFDSDWVGCSQTRISTTDYCTFLGSNCISWSATIAELTWLTYLLNDLSVDIATIPILHCENLSALHLSVNPVFHAHTKHIEINYYYVREQIALHKLETRQVFSPNQLVNMFTKPLLTQSFEMNLRKLGICSMSSLNL